jgi:hypothetical protein
MGLELQVTFNKGAVMLLPSGVNKATGLRRALEGLTLSPVRLLLLPIRTFSGDWDVISGTRLRKRAEHRREDCCSASVRWIHRQRPCSQRVGPSLRHLRITTPPTKRNMFVGVPS